MIELALDKKQLSELGRKLDSIDPKKRGNVMVRAFRAVVTEAERYMKEDVLTGQTLNVRTGRLRSSIGSRIEDDSVGIIGSGVRQGKRVPYANIHETGGIVEPKTAKYLAIPLQAAKTPAGVARARPRDYANTFVAKTGSGNLIIFQRLAGKAVRALFILKKSVEIPARPYMSDTRDYMAKNIMDIMTGSIERQLEGKAI